jgi:predicted RNA binding protein YcfA (HicA-like mRNA interferase family)
MPAIEPNTRKIIARLKRDGWVDTGGARHAVFEHPDRKDHIAVPRHKTLSPGVARAIAKQAGWLK